MKKIIARTILGIFYAVLGVLGLLVLVGIISIWPIFVGAALIVILALGLGGLIAWAWENS